MNIGIAIKKLRKSQGLNQKQFAELIGSDQANLSKFETGVHHPTEVTLKRILDYFQIPEILLIMLAVDNDDIPDEKRGEFERIFPNMQRVLLSLFTK